MGGRCGVVVLGVCGLFLWGFFINDINTDKIGCKIRKKIFYGKGHLLSAVNGPPYFS